MNTSRDTDRRPPDVDLGTVIECASLAPSVHNTQPWEFVAPGDTFDVRADRSRALSYLDPTGRLLHISCGAATEFARLAIRSFGRECTVSVLPEPADPDLVARLTIGGSRPATAAETELVAAIARRYTDRRPYSDDLVPNEILDDATVVAIDYGVWLRRVEDRAERSAVATILSDAEATEAADPAYAEELAAWLRAGGSVEGLPTEAVAAWPAGKVSDVPLRDFTGHARHPVPGGTDEPPRVERDSLLLLGTDCDDPADWVQTGRALGYLLLRVTVGGATGQPLGPAIDLPAARTRLRHELGLVGYPQFLLRVGFGADQPHSRRRPPGALVPTPVPTNG
jgi:nitroreductase